MSDSPGGSDIHAAEIRTTSGFRAAVQSMTPLKFAEAVSELTEAERKKLSRTAQDLFRELRNEATAARREFFAGAFLRQQLPMPINPVAELALLAVAPKSAAVRLMEFRLSEVPLLHPAPISPEGTQAEQAAIRILCDRRPDWADDWLEIQLNSGRWTGSLNWKSIRRLITQGVCRRPVSQRYVEQFAWHVTPEELHSQPDLLEDVWLLFQFDLHVFDKPTPEVLPAQPGWSGQQRDSWPRRIEGLLESGHMDRSRLQQVLLESLWQERHAGGSAGLAKFHDLLQFTDDELIAQQWIK